MKTQIRLSLFILLLSVILGCGYRKKLLKNTQQEKLKSEPTAITIFIHGTRLPDFALQIPFFYNMCYCPPGLTPVQDLHERYRLKNIQALHTEDPQTYSLKTLYLFGWSGALNFEARYRAAQDLYKALQEIKKQYPELPITLITHSHGGNVALNLAKITEENNDTTLVIDRLILLACPVQKHTAKHVHAPLFKIIHALYSPIDITQIADPQGVYACSKNCSCPLLSERHFPQNSKLTHCRIRMNGRGMGHLDFVSPKFIKSLPEICKNLENHETRAKLKKVRRTNEFIIRITS